MIPDYIIPQQTFEKVRDQIAFILAEELPSKIALIIAGEGTYPLQSPTLYVDLWDNLNAGELPGIVINFADFTNEAGDGRSSRNRCRYFVDIYYSAKATPAERGYQISHRTATRIAGLVYFIINSPQYQFLGLPNVCGRVKVPSVGVFTKENVEDARSTAFMRCVIEVVVNEDHNEVAPGVPLEISSTKFKLQQNDRGMFTVYNIA